MTLILTAEPLIVLVVSAVPIFIIESRFLVFVTASLKVTVMTSAAMVAPLTTTVVTAAGGVVSAAGGRAAANVTGTEIAALRFPAASLKEPAGMVRL